MATSDLNVLLEMGFDKERAEIATKKTGGLQGALQWLEDNQDKDIESIRAPATNTEDDPNEEAPALKVGEVAKSLLCDECGKKFRSVTQAEAHGERTGHQEFSESTEEIAPLTEGEKKEKLAELKQKAIERRTLKEKMERRKQRRMKVAQKIRMKSTSEIQTIKEDLEKKERIKEAAAKKQEKINDIAAKKRIQEKIAADKEERRLKAEKIKAEREGRAPPPEASAVAAAAAAPAPSSSGPKVHTEARLRLQTSKGNIMKTFPADTTLFEVAESLKADDGLPSVQTFTTTFPKKVFEGAVDFGKTLKEAGMVPSAVVIVQGFAQ